MQDPILRAKARQLAARKKVAEQWSAKPHLSSLRFSARKLTQAVLAPFEGGRRASDDRTSIPTILYRAGKNRVKEIDNSLIGGRDEGWYGEGLYLAEDPEYVTKWYGPVLTAMSVDPDAKVLRAGISPSEVSQEVIDAVLSNEKRLLRLRGAEEEFEAVREDLESNQIEWVHAVDRLAEAENYDVVWFSPHEIVVKNLKMVAIVQSGKSASGQGPSTLPMKGSRHVFYVYGDDKGHWDLSSLADFTALKNGRWQMVSGITGRHSLSVDGATEWHRGFRKALGEIVDKYPEIRDWEIMFDGAPMPVSKLVKGTATRPEVDLSKVTFYHGTSGAYWERIQREGLRPRTMTKVDPVHGVDMGAAPGRLDAIYLTTQANTAIFAARDASRRTRSDMVVLKVKGLDPDKFVPDEDSREDTAVASLERLGSVAYTGVIPPNKIKLHYVEEAYRGKNASSKEARPTTNTVAIESLIKQFNAAFPRVKLWLPELENRELIALQKALREWVPIAKALVPFTRQWEFEDDLDEAGFPKRKLTNIRKFVEGVAKARTIEDLETFLREAGTKSKSPWEKWWEMSQLLRGLIRGYDVEFEGNFDIGGFRVRMWSDPVADWDDKKVGGLRWLLTQAGKLLAKAGASKVLDIRVLAYPGDKLPKNYAGTHSALAAYEYANDVLAIAAGRDPRRALRSVIHELGHRYYYKVMSSGQRDAWRAFYDQGFGSPPDLDGIISRWEQAAEEDETKRWLAYYARDIENTNDFAILSQIRSKGFLKDEKMGSWGPTGTPALEQIKAKKGEIKVYLYPVGTGYSGSSASELFAESFAFGITKGKGVMPEIVQDAFGRVAPRIKLGRGKASPYVYNPDLGLKWSDVISEVVNFNRVYDSLKRVRTPDDIDTKLWSYLEELSDGATPTSRITKLGFWIRSNWPGIASRMDLYHAEGNLIFSAETLTKYRNGDFSQPSSLLYGKGFSDFYPNFIQYMERYIKEVNALLEQASPAKFTRHGIQILNPERLPDHTVKALMQGIDFVVALFKKRGAEGVLAKTVSEVLIRHSASNENALGWYHFGTRQIEMMAHATTTKNPRMLNTWVEEVFLHEVGHHMHNMLPRDAYEFWNSGWTEAENVEKDKRLEIEKYNEEIRNVTGADRKRYWDLLVRAKADLRKIKLKGLDRMKFHAWLSNPSYNESLVTPKQLRWAGNPWIPRFIQDPERYIREDSWVTDESDIQGQISRTWERAQDWLGIGPGWGSIVAPRLSDEEVSKYRRLDSEIDKAVMEVIEPLHVPTDYATTNKYEDFAETFVAFMAAPEKLSPEAKFRMQRTLSLAGLYGKPIMRLARRYMALRSTVVHS